MNKTLEEEKTMITLSRDFAVMGNNIEYMKRDLNDMKIALGATGAHYVSRDEFDPVKRIVYGMVALILASVVLGVIALVVRK